VASAHDDENSAPWANMHSMYMHPGLQMRVPGGAAKRRHHRAAFGRNQI